MKSLLLRLFAGVALLTYATSGIAWGGGAPDWVKAAAATALPALPGNPRGVVLVDEITTTVSASGEIRSLHRTVWRILTSAGRDLGEFAVRSDSETRLKSMHAWSITAKGEETQVGDREGMESSAVPGELYSDQKVTLLRVPNAEPGNIVAVEYERRGRPYSLQDSWTFQTDMPVIVARYSLVLPDGWSHDETWFNSAGAAPARNGDATVWEMRNVTALKDEAHRAPYRAIAPRMSVNFIPPRDQLAGKTHRTWNDVAAWYLTLTSDRTRTTPQLAAKTRELTAGKTSVFEKVAAIAAFTQHDVRYVAIEIGIGGYQPHYAADILTNHYGDCKDKVTLMRALLSETGVASDYVLATTERRSVEPSFASVDGFNHVVIAVPLGDDAPTLPAIVTDPHLGKILLFDPTDEMTPIGWLPEYLQNNELLVVTSEGGTVIHTATGAPEVNRLTMAAKLTLDADGALRGAVRETRSGSMAAAWRVWLHGRTEAERLRGLHDRLGAHLTQFEMHDFAIENLNDSSHDLIFRYEIVARSYARTAGALLLVRPRVLGEKAESPIDLTDRASDYETEGPSLQVDDIEIVLPEGVSADELPPPVHVNAAGFRYGSETSMEKNVLHYRREYRVERFSVPRVEMAEANRVFTAIMADERSSAVLKKP
jgi:predicted transglutaminase-like cysteine proteinase